jgi:hypothetical protein
MHETTEGSKEYSDIFVFTRVNRLLKIWMRENQLSENKPASEKSLQYARGLWRIIHFIRDVK